MADRQRNRLNIKRTAAAEPMLACDMHAAEAILAKLVTRAFALGHPELFVPSRAADADRAEWATNVGGGRGK